jgi:hypothetical protein
MNRLFARVADGQFLPSSTGSLYVNPSAQRTFVKGFLLHNISNENRVARIFVVPGNGGSIAVASAVHRILDVDLAPRETLLFELPYPLTLQDQGDTIQGDCSSTSSITIQLLGDKAE